MIKITTTAKTVTVETESFKWNIVKSRIKGQIPYASGTRLLTEMGEVTLPFNEVQGNGDAFGDAEELQAWVEANCFSQGGGTGEGVQSIQEGPGITVDNSDPGNPIISSNFSNPTWGSLEEKPAFMAVGDTAAQARSAIGLGSASTRPASDFDASGSAAAAELAAKEYTDQKVGVWTSYFISATGSNTNDGLSPETPWADFDNTVSLAVDTPTEILLKSGDSFSGSLGFIGKTAGILISTYGGDERATINMEAGNSQPINIFNCSNVTIENIRVVGLGAATWLDKSGINIFNDTNLSGENYKIINCEVTDVGYWGIAIGMWADPGTIKMRGVEVSDCLLHGNMDGLFIYGNQDHEYTVENAVIRRVQAYDNLGSASVTWSHSGSGIVVCGLLGGLIEDCKTWNNGQNSNSPDGGPYGTWMYNCNGTVIRHCESFNNKTGNSVDGGGFDIDGGCQNCVVEYCYSHGNEGPGILFYQFDTAQNAWTSNIFRFNTSFNDGRGGYTGAIMYGGEISGGTLHDNKISFSIDGMTPISGAIVAVDDALTVNVEMSRNTMLIGSDVPALPASSAKLTLKNNVVFETSGSDWIIQTAV